MFGKRFELNEQTIPVIEEIGKHMPGGFFIYEASGEEKVLYANQAVINLFGCDDLEDFKKLTGYTFRGMLHPEDYAEVSGSINEQIKSSDDNLDYVEYRIIRKDGSVCWVDDYGHYTETEAYGGVYYVFISDITKKREHQALSDALKSAEEANKAKTVFLSNMSHEIRTPMNAIIGMYSLALRKEGLDPETREYLEKIGASARHLLGLINDILDMSRIESGRLLLRQEDFSFRNMLEEINTMVMTQCSDRGLKYECRVTGGVSDFYIGDDGKLKQVLINILSNAIKFTEAPGLISLTVERTNVYNDQSTLKFVIKDTGIGMDPSFLPRIFDTFTQEDSGRSNKYGSTGLGMAITKNIVELMNGTISVSSEKGVGSEFTVVLTLKNSDHIGVSDSGINPSDMRVLVVDDEEIAAEHARMVLDEAGIKADMCLSGEEALQMIRVQHTKLEPYNLVLLDWKMPGMDGLELAAEIRKLYSSETTIIILTSFNWDEIMDEALHIGVDSFLAKPLFASNVISEFERIARKNNMSLFREKKRADLNGRRILLAEDIEINAEIMKKLLESRGAVIDHAVNGKVVVEMFKDHEPGYYDAILMDVRMPEMDGLEATETIRSLDNNDAVIIPAIAMTANAFDEDVQHSMQVGMNVHLSKPVEPDRLFNTLEELIYEAYEKRAGL
ncbi:MAG: response regulator [Lachnospiraceae bacterium]|nr:response regulator [Lachnospiraceae bacterium]